MQSEPIDEFVISAHARSEMQRRGLTQEIIQQVIASPEQRVGVREHRIVLHSRVMMGTPQKMYLVRVVIDTDRRPARVVTVYRTTKVDKYWRTGP
jgi:uncharacterized protein DUF4258